MKKTRKTLIRLQRDNPWSTEKIRDKQGNSRATRESAVLQAQYTVQLPMDISSNISKLSLTYRNRVIASTVVLAVIMLIGMG